MVKRIVCYGVKGEKGKGDRKEENNERKLVGRREEGNRGEEKERKGGGSWGEGDRGKVRRVG